MGSIGCRETSARNYHYLLRKNPEERISLGLGLLVVFPVLSGGTKNNHTEKRNVGVPVGKASVFRGGFESGITVYYPVLCVCVCVCMCVRGRATACTVKLRSKVVHRQGMGICCGE